MTDTTPKLTFYHDCIAIKNVALPNTSYLWLVERLLEIKREIVSLNPYVFLYK